MIGGIVRFRFMFSLLVILCLNAVWTVNRYQPAVSAACPPITASNIAQLIPLQHIPDQHAVAEIQFSPDNRSLITVQDVRGDETAQRWDLATDQRKVEVKLEHSDAPRYLIAPDGYYLAQGTALENHVMQTPVALYDLTTGKRRLVTPFDAVPLFFRADQKSLVVQGTGSDGAPYRVQWDTGGIRRIFDLSAHPSTFMVAVSPDLRWVVTTGIDIDYHAVGPLQLWDSSTGRERTDIFSDKNTFLDYDGDTRAAFSANGRYVIMLGENETRLIDLVLAKQIAVFPAAGNRADFSQDSRFAVAYYDLGPVPPLPLPIVDVTAGGNPVATLPADASPLGFSADSKLLAFGQGPNVHFWDMDQRTERSVIPGTVAHDGQEPDTWLLNADGSLFALYANNNHKEQVTWWDTRTGQAIARYAMGKPVRFSADTTLIATAANTDEITVWGVSPCELPGTPFQSKHPASS